MSKKIASLKGKLAAVLAKGKAAGDKTEKVMSKATAKLVADFTPMFQNFARDFGKVFASRAELAPKFERVFTAWKNDTAGSFVGFVRLMAPEVPQDRDGYRNHPVYQAAQYLKRLADQQAAAREAAASGGKVTKPTKSVRSQAQIAGRAIATILPLVGKDAGRIDAFWRSVVSELALKPRQATALRKLVGNSKPLIEVGKVTPIKAIKVIHQTPEEQGNMTTAAHVEGPEQIERAMRRAG